MTTLIYTATPKQHKPKQNEINALENQKQKHNTQTIIDFLTSTDNALETTAEFIFEDGYWKNIYSNKEDSNLKFMPSENKWLYLIRISEIKEIHRNKNYEFETQGLLGFYSTEDLRESILPKQLIMLLRKDMSVFIKKHYKNDEFRTWIENEKIRKVYESKFDKFNHSAKRFIDIFQKLVTYPVEQEILIAMSEVIKTQIEFGSYYAKYLEEKTRNEKWTIKLNEETNSEYAEKDYLEIETIIENLKKVYSDRFNETMKCDISFTNFREIRTQLPFIHLKGIIIELICNSLLSSMPENKIEINFDDSKLIAMSYGRKLPSNIEIIKLKRHIQNDFPIYHDFGIGLFMIEKIVFHNFDQHIQVESMSTGEFKVIVPLNKIKS